MTWDLKTVLSDYRHLSWKEQAVQKIKMAFMFLSRSHLTSQKGTTASHSEGK